MTLTVLPGGDRDATAEAFRGQIARFRRPEQKRDPETGGAGANGMQPTAYEMVTRQMVESIAEDVRDIKSKLGNLIFVLTGAVLLDIASRALGG